MDASAMPMIGKSKRWRASSNPGSPKQAMMQPSGSSCRAAKAMLSTTFPAAKTTSAGVETYTGAPGGVHGQNSSCGAAALAKPASRSLTDWLLLPLTSRIRGLARIVQPPCHTDILRHCAFVHFAVIGQEQLCLRVDALEDCLIVAHRLADLRLQRRFIDGQQLAVPHHDPAGHHGHHHGRAVFAE